MVIMSYSNLYSRRIAMRGGTNRIDRNIKAKTKSFERYFEGAINKEPVNIDGVDQYAVFTDQNMSNNQELSDDKYVVVPLGSNMKAGSYIYWRDNVWLVFSEESKTIKSHKQGKVKPSNHHIKWMIDGAVAGNGQGHPAFIKNQTLYTLGVSSSGNHSWIVNAKMTMYLQDNEETRTIKIGQRIFIGGAVYQVMFRDYVSRDGIFNYLLEQDMVNEDRDDLVNQIADYHTSIEANKEQEPTGAIKEVTINGSTHARIGTLVKYEAEVFSGGTRLQEGITDWTIADVDGVSTVVEQTSEYITLRIENNFKRVGSVISVVGRTVDGVIGSKTVSIISPY